MAERLKQGLTTAWLKHKALAVLTVVALAIAAIGGSLVVMTDAFAEIAVTKSVNWAVYEITDTSKTPNYDSDNTVKRSPLLLVFSTKKLGSTYNSGQMAYGNKLKRVVGSGDANGSKTLQPWDAENGVESASSIPWHISYGGSNLYYRIYAVQNANDSDLIVPKDVSRLFQNCRQLQDISDLRYWNTSNLTRAESLFQDCRSLQDVSAISDWNVSRVTSIHHMFKDCAITSVELWDWNIPEHTNIQNVFEGCSKLETIYCNHSWNNPSNASNTFLGCSTLLRSASSGAVWDSSHISGEYCNPNPPADPSKGKGGYFTGVPVVQVPRPYNLIYNGKPQVGMTQPLGAKLSASDSPVKATFFIDSAGNAVATDAGTYGITAKLSADNFVWAPDSNAGTITPSDKDPRKLDFTIHKAELFFEIPDTVSYSGSSIYVPVSFTSDSERLELHEGDVSSIKANTGNGVGASVRYFGDGQTLYVELQVGDSDLKSIDFSIEVDGGAQNIIGNKVERKLTLNRTKAPQGRALVYNGNSQVGVYGSSDYVLSIPSGVSQPDGLGIDGTSGDAKALHAGDYQVIATLKDSGSVWDSTGDNKPKQVNFRIAKATPTIEVSTSDGHTVAQESGLAIGWGDTIDLKIQVSYPNGNGGKNYVQLNSDIIKATTDAGAKIEATTFSENTCTLSIKATGAVGVISDLSISFNSASKNSDFLTTTWYTPIDILEKPAVFPVQNDEMIFNGDSQNWEFDMTGFTLGDVKNANGNASTNGDYGKNDKGIFATHAGTYTVDAMLKEGYGWSDGNKSNPRQITFTIKKATPEIEINPTEITRYVDSTATLENSKDKPGLAFTVKFKDGNAIMSELLSNDSPRIDISTVASTYFETGVAKWTESGVYKVPILPKTRGVGSVSITVGSNSYETNSDFTAVTASIHPKVTIKDVWVEKTKESFTFNGSAQYGVNLTNSKYDLDEIELENFEVTALPGSAGANSDGAKAENDNSRLQVYGTHAGVYSVNAKLKNIGSGACWHDGSTGTRTLTFTINKAKSTLNVTPFQLQIDAGQSGTVKAYLHLKNDVPDTKVYTGLADSALSAAENPEGNLTVSKPSPIIDTSSDNGKFSISVTPALGITPTNNPAIVNVTFAGNDDIEAPASQSFSVSTKQYQLTYDSNGGTWTESLANNPSQHVKGETVSMATGGFKLTHGAVNGKRIAFVGWSKNQSSDYLSRGEDFTPLENVTFDNGKDITVYAVWGIDSDGNGTADVNEKPISITYDFNDGKDTKETVEGYIPGDVIELKASSKPTHDPLDGKQVVFVGWSNVQMGICTRDANKETIEQSILTKYTMGNENAIVWAVWAYDGNSNGEADFMEDSYSLTYRENGGDASSMPIDTNSYLFGDEALLEKYETGANKPTHSDTSDGKPVIFVGWTETPVDGIYGIDDVDSHEVGVIDKIKFNNSDQNVYACWAEDANDNGEPDYEDAKVQLIYDINGGIEGSGPGPQDCLAETTVSLVPEPKPKHDPVETTKDVIFIGWSESTAVKGKVFDKTASESTITGYCTDSVRMQNSNKTVFAVWALDSDWNGTPDYAEPKYTLTYDANGGDKGSVPRDTDQYLSGEEKSLDSTIPTHAIQDGKRVIFVGWTETPDSTIYDRTFTKDTVDAGLVKQIKFVDRNVTVYARWAYDANGDSTADYLQDAYKLTYNINGGTGSVPTDDNLYLTGEVVRPLAENPKPNHAPTEDGKSVVFVGWSKEAKNTIFGRDATTASIAGVLLNGVTFTDQSITVYAVWAKDANNNKTADCQEDKYSLTYDGNSVGPTNNLPRGSDGYIEGDQVALVKDPKPTRGNVGGRPVVFIGWSRNAEVGIFESNASPDTVNSQLVPNNLITFEKADVRVYAVWGYDADGDGTADCLEKKIKLTFDANGGSSTSGEHTGTYTIEVFGGESVHLPVYSELQWTRQWDGKNTILVGWTTPDVIEGAILSNDLDSSTSETPGGLGLSKRLLKGESYIVPQNPDSDVILHAAYAVDAEGNDIPDYLTDSVHVEYWANDGSMRSGLWFDDIENLVYRCGHHHVPGETGVSLLSLAESRELVERNGAVLLGWSLKENTPLVNTESDEGASGIIADGDYITMNPTGNTKVYAVWAEDVNGNGIADYREAKPKLTYDSNGGTGENMPNPLESSHLSGGEPIKLETYATAENMPKHAIVLEKAVIFAGWSDSEEVINKIYSFEDRASVPKTIDSIIMPANDVTIYAMWAYDENDNQIPDYEDDTISVNYDLNGGEKADASDFPDSVSDLKGRTITLWQPTRLDGSDKPIREDAVFLGWSTNRESLIPGDWHDTEPLIITEVLLDDNKTVYALWAEDKNSDGIADYKPNQHVKITFKINGGRCVGEAGSDEYEIKVLKGTPVPFPVYGSDGTTAGQLNWVKTWDGYKDSAVDSSGSSVSTAILAGWSKTAISDVILRDDGDAGAANLSKKLIDTEEYLASKDETFYAVYAADENGTNGPDFREPNRVWLDYYSNGGTDAQGGVLDGSKPFYTSSHSYVPGEDHVMLMSREQAATRLAHEGATLVGWSRGPKTPPISERPVETDLYLFDEAGLAPAFKMDEGNEDTKVYALWAQDSNGNQIPDYSENKYVLTYALNTSLAKIDASGDAALPEGVAKVVIGSDEIPSSTSSVPSTIYPGGSPTKSNIISGTRLDLTNVRLAQRVDYTSGDAIVHRYTNVGWSLDEPKPVVTNGTDLARWNNAGSSAGLLINGDKTIYALWALDDNANGSPDFQEKLTLYYDANTPADGDGRVVTNLPKNQEFTYDLGSVQVSREIPICSDASDHQHIVFMGWSWTADSRIYDMLDSEPKDYISVNEILDGFEVRKGEIANGKNTLYAVWGFDEDKNDIADVYENRFTLTYYPGMGSGDSQSETVAAGAKVQIPDASAKGMEAPTGDGAKVMFVGWTPDRINFILDQNLTAADVDAINTRLSRVDMLYTMPKSDAYLYAVWGYDRNDNNVPDYDEDKAALNYVYDYSLASDLNYPPENGVYLVGTNIESLWTIPNEHGDRYWTCTLPEGNCAFVGWTTDREFGSHVLEETAIKEEVNSNLVTSIKPITVDTTLYAVWAVDANGNGIPDYQEATVELDYYTSGSTESNYSVASRIHNLVSGSRYPLISGSQFKKTYDGGKIAVFAGWSDVDPTKVKYENVDDENARRLYAEGIIPDNECEIRDNVTGKTHVLSNTIVGKSNNTYTIPKNPDDGVAKLYAIYAVDEWGKTTGERPNGIPDYLEKSEHVEYYANGGVAVDPTTTNVDEETGLFFTCGDHHVVGQEAQLMSVDDGRELIMHVGEPSAAALDDAEVMASAASRENGILVGWSTEQIEGFVKPEDLKTEARTTLEISNQNKVYALWGADFNGNSIWDELEPSIYIKYNLNGAEGNAPLDETPHKALDSVKTESGSWIVTKEVNENKTTGVFYGWSTTKIDGIVDGQGRYTTVDGMRHILNKAEVVKGGEYFTIPTSGGNELTLYAVYGVDSNQKGGADYWEQGYPVVYFANGGKAKTDTGLTVQSNGKFYECGHHHVADEPYVEVLLYTEVPASQLEKTDIDGTNLALIGFSAQINPKTCSSVNDETDVGLIGVNETITMPAGEAHLYAVWAVDWNKNRVPDYRERESLHVEYYANGGEAVPGSGLDSSLDLTKQPFYTCVHSHQSKEQNIPLLSTSIGRSAIQRNGYVLIGWSEQVNPKTCSEESDEKVAELLADNKLPEMPEGKNAQVYAVWAVDSNGDGTPDYRQQSNPLPSDPLNPGGSGSPSNPTKPDEPENPDEPDTPEDPGTETEVLIPVHRLYNPYSGEHLYTTDENEVRTLAGPNGIGWRYEGYAWKAPAESSVPVYRIYNRWSGEHLYTLSRHEADVRIGEGWRDEGIAWLSDEQQRVPIYRLFNPYDLGAGAHLYTTDYNEYVTLPPIGWNQEQIGWHAAEAGTSGYNGDPAMPQWLRELM